MTYDEIIENCTKEYTEHLHGVKKSLETLRKDKEMALGGQPEENATEYAKDKIQRDKKSWQSEWGIYGSRVKGLVEKHQRQVYDAVNQKELANDLAAQSEQAKEKSKQNGRGR